MKTNIIDVNQSIQTVRDLLSKEKEISLALKAAIETVLLAISLMYERLNKNSKNSHKPPSTDRQKKPAFPREKKKRNHSGSTLEQDKPDEVVVDRPSKCCNCGKNLKNKKAINIEKRQEINIIIKRHVTEYQIEEVPCDCGTITRGNFPNNITKAIQYGSSVKAQVCYCVTSQLLPYKRTASLLESTAGIKISEASIWNFLEEAYSRLEFWEECEKENLLREKSLNLDETGATVEKKKMWIHTYSGPTSTLLFANRRRGKDAIEAIGILPFYRGTIIHDCWHSYFQYQCKHGLCGCHIIRELNACIDFDKHVWAKNMKKLLQKINRLVNKTRTGKLTLREQRYYRNKYRSILRSSEKECPPKIKLLGVKGKTKNARSRNLLERLKKYEDEILFFMSDSNVPFTNNLAERDLRMTKVQQKISGCFRSMLGAQIFCRIRSYLITSQKQGSDHLKALLKLFA